MLRQNNEANSPFVYLALSQTGIDVSYTEGGDSNNIAHVSGSQTTAPTWLKLERKEGSVLAYESDDGINFSLITTITLALSNPFNLGLATAATNAQVEGQFEQVLVQEVTENSNEFANSGTIGVDGGVVYIPGVDGKPETDIAVAEFTPNFLKDNSEITFEVTERIFENQYGSAENFGDITLIGPQVTLIVPLEAINAELDKAELLITVLPYLREFEEPISNLSGSDPFWYEYVVHYELDDGTIFTGNRPLNPGRVELALVYAGEFNIQPYISSTSEVVNIIIQPIRIDRNDSSSSSIISTHNLVQAQFDEMLVQVNDPIGFPDSGILDERGGAIYIPSQEQTAETNIATAYFQPDFLLGNTNISLEVTQRTFENQYGSAALSGEVTPVGPQVTLTIPFRMINLDEVSDGSELYVFILPFEGELEQPIPNPSGTDPFWYVYTIRYELDDGTQILSASPLNERLFAAQIFADALNREPFTTAASEFLKIIIQPIRIDRNESSSSSIISTHNLVQAQFEQVLVQEVTENPNEFANSGTIGVDGGAVYIPGVDGTPETDIAIAKIASNFFSEDADITIEVTERVFDDQYGDAPLLGEVIPIGPQVTVRIPLGKINSISDGSSPIFITVPPFIRDIPEPTLDSSGTYIFRYEYVIRYELDDGTTLLSGAPLRSETLYTAKLFAGRFNSDPFISSNSEFVKIIIQPIRIDANNNNSSSNSSISTLGLGYPNPRGLCQVF